MRFLAMVCSLSLAAAAQAAPVVEGVYKNPITISIFNGPGTRPPIETDYEHLTVENILELVRIDQTHDYFRAKFISDNAHVCDLSGVAEWAGEKQLRYFRDSFTPGKPCRFTIDFDESKISFGDEGYSCKSISCGARADYTAVQFERSKRRPIRYLSTILKSSEYRAALTEAAEKKQSSKE